VARSRHAPWLSFFAIAVSRRAAGRGREGEKGWSGETRAPTGRGLGLEALKIAGNGLARRNRLNKSGATEAVFLEPLIEFALANETPAERKLKLFHGPWNGSVDPVFKEFAY